MGNESIILYYMGNHGPFIYNECHRQIRVLFLQLLRKSYSRINVSARSAGGNQYSVFFHFTSFDILRITPAANILKNNDEPPKPTKGRVSPFVGRHPVTTAIFKIACRDTRNVIPIANTLPRYSLCFNAILTPRQVNKANRTSIPIVPTKPSSWPITAYTKSVCTSGIKNNF